MKKIYLLLFFFSIHHYSIAQFSNDTTNNSVVWDSSGTEQLTPLIATTDAGNTYISWFDSHTSPYELRMQFLDANGNKLWGPQGIVVSNFPQNTAVFRYDLKVDHENNAIVAFQDIRFTDLKVVAYKVDQSGNLLWGSNGVELADSTAQGLSPVIGITGANDCIIAWNADVGASKWISYQKISSAGNVLWSQRVFDSTNVNKYSRAQLVAYGADDFIMQYVQEIGNFPGITSTLFAQHFDMNGDPVWTTPVQVSTKTIPFFVFPKIVSDGNNGFFIVFDTSNPVNSSFIDVYAQHVDSSGNLWSADGIQVANSSTEHKSTGGFCYSEANNELYVVMQILDAGQSNSGVGIQGLDINGNALFGANGIQLKNPDPIYFNPHALVDAGNGLIAIFSYGSFGAQHLSSIKTDYTGSLMWGYEPIICNYNSNKDDLSAGTFINDQTVIVWDDDRIDYGVYMQNLKGDGSFGIITNINEIRNVNQIALYPNPSQSTYVSFMSDKNEQVIIVIRNLEGKEYSRKIISAEKGLNEVNLQKAVLGSGIYIVSVYTDNTTNHVKWVKR
jgi:hypothetical protein